MNKSCLRVCRLAESFPPPWSGLNPGIFDLSVAQSKQLDLTVITKKRNLPENHVDPVVPFRLVRVSGRSLLWDIIALRTFFILHKEEPFNLVHVHGGGSVLSTIVLSVLTKIPIVGSVHCVRHTQYSALRSYDEYKFASQLLSKSYLLPKLLKTWQYRRWFNPELIRERYAFKALCKLLCVNQALIEDIIDSYSINIDKLLNIRNGVNYREFIPAYNNGAHSSNRLLFVGRIIARKDLSPILIALSRLKIDYPNIDLIVAGEGKFKKILEELVDFLKLADSVFFLGNISKCQLIKEYQRCNAFILPSVSEGLPKVLLEAMSCSKPVIVSDIPQHQFIIENGINGYLVQLDDVNGWVSAIRNIIEDIPLSSQMGMNNRKLIEKEYSWDDVAKRCIEAYRTILNNCIPY